MAPRVGRSATWYSDSGAYMSEINKLLQSRPMSGAVDDFGRHDMDDDWERIWMDAPEDWDQEII